MSAGLNIHKTEAATFAALTGKAGQTLDLAKSGVRAPVITAQCHEDFCLCLLEDKMRFINGRYLVGLTDAELASLGLKPRNDHSPVPPPTSFAEADVSYPGVHTLVLHPRSVADQPPLDPRSDYGHRIYRGMPPHSGATVEAATSVKREPMKPPTSSHELPHSQWTRRRKERFSFHGDSSKTVYFCILYWERQGRNRRLLSHFLRNDSVRSSKL